MTLDDILTAKPQLETPLVHITPQSGNGVLPPVAPKVPRCRPSR